MRVHLLCYTFLWLSGFYFNQTMAQPALDKIKLTPVMTDFSVPIAIASCGDDRIFIVEKRGVIKIGYPDGTVLAEPFLDIRDRVISGGERGLLGLAFPPDYKETGSFYVNYTGLPELTTVVSRFRVGPDSNKAIAQLETILLEESQPFNNHNGGCIEFGHDGYLYIGMGDGGSSGDPNNYSQTPGSFLGKILRIDVNTLTGNYNIPVDNPFILQTEYRPEIWAMGVRNPWRFSFDPRNGDMWMADVGQNRWEEINFEKAGEGGHNYGWRCYEGYEPYNTSGCQDVFNYKMPAAVYSHNGGNCSVTGGQVFVSDTMASLYGYYIYADYCTGIFRGIKSLPEEGFHDQLLFDAPFGGFTAFGYDQQRNIYVVRDQGTIYRLDTIEHCADLAIQTGKTELGCGPDTIHLSVQHFDFGNYAWYVDGQVINGANDNEISITEPGSYYVRFIADSCVAESRSPLVVTQQTSIGVSFTGLQPEYCINGAPLPLQGTPSGGLFFGTGVVDSVFYPDSAGLGPHLITYYFEDGHGCSGFDTYTIDVNKAPVTDITTFVDIQCLQGPPLALTAEPAEGFFSGFGVSGSNFYPQVAGLGTHKIVYSYTPWPGCEAKDSIYITVEDCSISTNSHQDETLTLFPNPTDDIIIIETTGVLSDIRSVEITDLVGKRVLFFGSPGFKPSTSQAGYKIGHLMPGIYHVIVNHKDRSTVIKLIKM